MVIQAKCRSLARLTGQGVRATGSVPESGPLTRSPPLLDDAQRRRQGSGEPSVASSSLRAGAVVEMHTVHARALRPDGAPASPTRSSQPDTGRCAPSSLTCACSASPTACYPAMAPGTALTTSASASCSAGSASAAVETLDGGSAACRHSSVLRHQAMMSSWAPSGSLMSSYYATPAHSAPLGHAGSGVPPLGQQVSMNGFTLCADGQQIDVSGVLEGAERGPLLRGDSPPPASPQQQPKRGSVRTTARNLREYGPFRRRDDDGARASCLAALCCCLCFSAISGALWPAASATASRAVSGCCAGTTLLHSASLQRNMQVTAVRSERISCRRGAECALHIGRRRHTVQRFTARLRFLDARRAGAAEGGQGQPSADRHAEGAGHGDCQPTARGRRAQRGGCGHPLATSHLLCSPAPPRSVQKTCPAQTSTTPLFHAC
jgi:Cysteine-rich TM module stress tolerance